MAYVKLSDFVFDCNQCHTRCDGISKGIYLFENDTTFSERYEQMIIEKINHTKLYIAVKSQQAGYPDIEIKNLDGTIHHYLEVKVQQRTFMSIEKYLPDSNLKPSETVALNLSDLLRYFDIERQTRTSIGIVWVLLNRLCLVDHDAQKMYYQQTKTLAAIYEKERQKRKFTRKSGEGDVVDGLHKGVTVNYHFSLKELRLWNI